MPVTRKAEHAVTNAVALWLAADGWVPNNGRLPLILYRAAIPAIETDAAVAFEDLFRRNGWPPEWRNGVYPFHHFHSNAHEALGVYSGEVTVQFGGDDGVVLTARPGDVIVLPAGTGHKRLASRGALGIVGAYPAGAHPDMCRPEGVSRSHHAEAVARVPLPECDPIYGAGGPLSTHWT